MSRSSSAPNSTANSATVAWTYVAEDHNDGGVSQLSEADLRVSLEKGSEDVKLQVLRYIITNTLNGTSYVSVVMRMYVFQVYAMR